MIEQDLYCTGFDFLTVPDVNIVSVLFMIVLFNTKHSLNSSRLFYHYALWLLEDVFASLKVIIICFDYQCAHAMAIG